ncbi:PREDICTED: pentatricopeptide repeat-containing protein At4g04370 [Nicotiana attenuata]|uniref:pentatricopeptide repeat-containing protein At4g04370 n=1 Tax=Nicotiana attenuata TaxID=49451 RepID=UPI0009047781|nr:PREDICTED: pentatricopeptide repeat-containing protein At4g04370 [Nicotiana attenuata]
MHKLKLNILFRALTQTPLRRSSAATTTKSFNATLHCLSSEGAHHHALLTYNSMLKSSVPPDPFTFPALLKACISLNLLPHGLLLHQHVVVNGFSSDPYIGSSLISFYSSFGLTERAHKMFDIMPDRNIVPWTAVIGCYVRSGDFEHAFVMYNSMLHDGVKPTSVTMLTMLSGVSESIHVECLHASVVKYGFVGNTVLLNSMLNVYGKCGRIEYARKLFAWMDEKDIVSWNSLASGYSLVGDTEELLRLMYRMRLENTWPDYQTYGSLVSAIAKEGCAELGKVVHGQIVAAGFELDVHLETSLMFMYLKCRNMDYTFKIFERAKEKDVVLWTTIISGLVQNERADRALQVFQSMLCSRIEPSATTIASALAACAQLGSLKVGTSIHGYMLRQRIALETPAQNSLVTMYSKCGYLKQALAVFDMIKSRDVVSWNAIVAGNAQNGHLAMALHLFNEMRISHQRPDSITVVSLLQICASIGAYQQGKWIHNLVVRGYFEPCVKIGTALVDMYCKCGDLDSARKCFDRIVEHDLISWSTIIAGYGSHGKGETALELYSELVQSSLTPNSVIFLSVFSACSHNGLVDQGMSLFDSMERDFKIEPELEHCACIVDLLCRAGRVKDAYNFYKTKFPEPMADALGIILDACKTKALVELRDIVCKEISMLDHGDAGRYVQLAHSYASMAQWEGVGKAWVQMRDLGLKKLPGWSFIDLHGVITTFFMGQTSHPQQEEIMLVLKNLSDEISERVIKSNVENMP